MLVIINSIDKFAALYENTHWLVAVHRTGECSWWSKLVTQYDLHTRVSNPNHLHIISSLGICAVFLYHFVLQCSDATLQVAILVSIQAGHDHYFFTLFLQLVKPCLQKSW